MRLPCTVFYERGELSYEAEPVAEASLADMDQTFHDTGASVIATLYGAVLPPEEVGIPLRVGPVTFGLNERQGKALEYLQTYGRMTRSDYSRICGVGSTQAYQELNEMLGKGLIVRQGKGRSTHYILAP